MVTQALTWFGRTWTAIDEQAASERAREPQTESRRQAQEILVLTSVILTLEWYYGDRPFFYDHVGKALLGNPTWSKWVDLLTFTWWSGAKWVGMLLIPAVHIWLRGESLGEYGFGFGSAPKPQGLPEPGKWVYLLLFCAVMPLVVMVSFTKAFQQAYPFYRHAGRSVFDFVSWELQYAATFLSLEFFFRGYLLFGLRRALGSNAIFVMVVPYCMIHYLKPASESLGAIVAGVVLGTLSMSTGSIWYGVLIHVSIAWSMDLVSCMQQGLLPTHGRWFP